MALHFVSSWFLFANSLVLLIILVARHVFRVKDTATNDTLLEFINLDSSSEEEEPRLIFKFQYQISNHHNCSNRDALWPADEEEEEENPFSETRIRKSEKGFSSSIKEQKVEILVDEESVNSETGLFDEVVDKDAESEEFTDPCSPGPQLDLRQGEVESSEVAASEEAQLKICGEDEEIVFMDEEYSDRKEVGQPTNSSTGTSSCSLNTGIETFSISIPNSEKLDSDLREQRHQTQKTEMKSSAGEDYDELEALWEHQELIEQLRTELRKLKDVGLPTIFEESESPRRLKDLKPLMLDESFLRDDPLNEMERSHWSYRERMRKLDILIYQKMHAIGFLQLKNPLRSVGSRKARGLAIQSILSQSFSRGACRKSNVDPSQKLIGEIQGDLEVVYVGQACLSWELLRWQYEKALPKLFDPSGHRFYDQAAREFQQFQVNIQRFIENEAFEGPRLPYYIKNRCVLRNLLQVPALKEDCSNGISGEMMEEIMKQSITIFWEFIKADKDQTVGILKVLMGTHVALRDPSDAGLLEDIQCELHQKEKKLKDITRTCNRLVKFKKPYKEDQMNRDVLFSRVDLKLVARVLKMPRITTEQLLWCHNKLSKIKFVERRVFREPSFLLFPC